MSKEDIRAQELVEDSDWTLARTGVIGHVNEVNGRGALAVPDFTASRYELIVLLQHWAEIELDLRFWQFCYEQTGSDHIRLESFAKRRVGRIADALADEACVNKAIDEVDRAYGERDGGLA